jgi:hypothetical protein
VLLADFWGVDPYIKGGKWPLGAVAILEARIRGRIEKFDPDTGESVIQDEATLQCSTDVQARDFMGALPIAYECVELS